MTNDNKEYQILKRIISELKEIPEDIRSQNYTAYRNEVEARHYELEQKYERMYEDESKYGNGAFN
jgi:hypothetical protein